MDNQQLKMTKNELKEIFPTCADIWNLEFKDYVIVTIINNYVTIDDKNGGLIYENKLF